MTRDEIEKATVDILAALLSPDATAESSRATVSAWDSLKHMHLVFAIEDRFGVEFTEEQIPRLDSVRSIVEHVQQSQAGADRG